MMWLSDKMKSVFVLLVSQRHGVCPLNFQSLLLSSRNFAHSFIIWSKARQLSSITSVSWSLSPSLALVHNQTNLHLLPFLHQDKALHLSHVIVTACHCARLLKLALNSICFCYSIWVYSLWAWQGFTAFCLRMQMGNYNMKDWSLKSEFCVQMRYYDQACQCCRNCFPY